jgi:hypothetical protein
MRARAAWEVEREVARCAVAITYSQIPTLQHRTIANMGTTYASCSVCDKRFSFFTRRHPECERKLLLRHLDRSGELSRDQAFYLSVPGWKPTEAPPTMRTINGFGTKLYHQRDAHAATMTATATLCGVILFVPVFPIAVYRVVVLRDNYYSFLARRRPQKADWMRVAQVWICILAALEVLHLIFD